MTPLLRVKPMSSQWPWSLPADTPNTCHESELCSLESRHMDFLTALHNLKLFPIIGFQTCDSLGLTFCSFLLYFLQVPMQMLFP